MQEKIDELEKRIVVLEKDLKRRKIISIISICIYGVVILGIVAGLIWLYFALKPYKEQIDNIGSFAGEKKDQIEDYYNSGDFFNDFSNFFNY